MIRNPKVVMTSHRKDSEIRTVQVFIEVAAIGSLVSMNGSTSVKMMLASVTMFQARVMLNTRVGCFSASSQFQEKWALGKWKSS